VSDERTTPSGIARRNLSTPNHIGRTFLISSAHVSPQQHITLAHTDNTETVAVSHHPASFKSRRQALNLSTSQLAALLGINASDVEVIESIPLGEEVSFLHNMTLSMLELNAI
jgi:DNA-binding transcriptional regulator YiaG